MIPPGTGTLLRSANDAENELHNINNSEEGRNKHAFYIFPPGGYADEGAYRHLSCRRILKSIRKRRRRKKKAEKQQQVPIPLQP